MTVYARRIAGARRASPFSSSPVVLIAEGWPAEQEQAFDAVCAGFWEGLLDTPGFNLLRRYPERVSVWSLFVPSPTEGPLGVAQASPAGATWDGTKLQLDPKRVLAFLEDSALPSVDGYGGCSLLQFIHGYQASNDGVIAFLLPPVSGGSSFSAEFDSVQPRASVPLTEQFRWVASTVDAGWERVVARALARSFGLGDEWSDAAAEFETPPPVPGSLGAYPRSEVNLVSAPAPTAPPDSSFRWYPELDARGRSRPLTVVPAGQLSPTPDEPIQLFEGAGWYRKGVYRSAADCFMRRRIGDSANSPRIDTVPFCTLCQRALTRTIAGTESPRSRIFLTQQRSKFDEIGSWASVERLAPPAQVTLDARSAPGPYWTFTARTGPDVGGLRIEDLRLLDQGEDSLAEETVVERIDFRDLAVEFDDGSKATFDVAKALTSTTTPPVVLVGTDGTLSPTDTRYPYGVKLTLTDDFDGRCPVQVDMSFVVRAEAADIDPPGALYACKFFPQLTLRWLPGGSTGVKRFRGCVRLVMNNAAKAHDMAGNGMGGHDMPVGDASPSTVVSFFTDTNRWDDKLMRLFPNPSRFNAINVAPLGFPMWWVIFDYHKPDFRADTEVRAVAGPGAPAAQRTIRSTSLKWPAGSAYESTTARELDQGQYDNVHTHGSMGVDPYDPRTPQRPMVHAPGCAEACIHTHWRWGSLGPLGAIPTPGVHTASFQGWSRNPGWFGLSSSEAHAEWGTPLIPPNQDLSVAITHPDTDRTDPWQPVVAASRDLDPRRKTIWYTTDVTAPGRGDAQVLVEFGLSFAYRYNYGATVNRITLGWLRLLTADPAVTDKRSDAEVQHLLYSCIRWYMDPTFHATGEQIPEGTAAAENGHALEDL